PEPRFGRYARTKRRPDRRGAALWPGQVGSRFKAVMHATDDCRGTRSKLRQISADFAQRWAARLQIRIRQLRSASDKANPRASRFPAGAANRPDDHERNERATTWRNFFPGAPRADISSAARWAWGYWPRNPSARPRGRTPRQRLRQGPRQRQQTS